MVNFCAVYQCGKSNTNGVELFRMPFNDENRLEKWIKYINRGPTWLPAKSTRICSSHFCSIVRDSKGRILSDPDKPNFKSMETGNNDAFIGLTRTTLREKSCNILSNGNISVGSGSNSIGENGQLKDTRCFTLECGSQTEEVTTGTTFTQTSSKSKKLLQQKKTITHLHKILKKKERQLVKLRNTQQQILDTQEKIPILKSMLKRQIRRTKLYGQTLKAFSIGLHFYSSKAHEFVRKTFAGLIPTRRQIQNWLQTIDISPGFLPICLSFLKELQQNSATQIIINIQVDEISIRQQITSNGRSYEGFVEYGEIINQNGKKAKRIAKSAMVILAVGVNQFFKIPIAYFLTNGVDSSFLVEALWKSLEYVDSLGILCPAIVCDGLGANLKAAELLGINLDYRNLKTWFMHPSGEYKVYFIFDMCHMIKLLRNLWKHFGVIFLNSKTMFDWQYIEELVGLQCKEGLKAANSLTSRHISFEQQKMKVKLAVQAFSSSVANSLRFCKELGVEEFQNSDATANFIETIDRLFDVLNSRNSLAKGFKAPLSKSNEHCWVNLFDQVENLLPQLKVHITSKKNPSQRIEKLIITTKRKTALLGMLVNIKSVTGLFNDLINNPAPKLKYILTYKLSQDHLETFFALIRSQSGLNNNPNSRQLKSAIKKILSTKILTVYKGNCEPQDDTTIPTIESCFVPPVAKPEQEMEPEVLTTLPDYPTLSKFTSCVVTYIAGWVVKKLKTKIRCTSCLSALEVYNSNQRGRDFALINLKQNGGLVTPSYDVIHLCKYVEGLFRASSVEPNFKAEKLYQYAAKFVLDNDLFSELSDHLKELEVFDNHIYTLTKCITNTYCTLRMHHASREATFSHRPISVRSQNTNLIQFAGD